MTSQLDMVNSRMLERIAKALEHIAKQLEVSNEQGNSQDRDERSDLT